jgi:hypothetical protein
MLSRLNILVSVSHFRMVPMQLLISRDTNAKLVVVVAQTGKFKVNMLSYFLHDARNTLDQDLCHKHSGPGLGRIGSKFEILPSSSRRTSARTFSFLPTEITAGEQIAVPIAIEEACFLSIAHHHNFRCAAWPTTTVVLVSSMFCGAHGRSISIWASHSGLVESLACVIQVSSNIPS